MPLPAGFYLVKYSIEAGLLGPTVRVMLGFIFGMALVWAAGRFVANNKELQRSACGSGNGRGWSRNIDI